MSRKFGKAAKPKDPKLNARALAYMQRRKTPPMTPEEIREVTSKCCKACAKL